MWPSIRRAGTAGVLVLTLVAAPPITSVVLAEEQPAEGTNANPEEAQEQPKPRDARLAKRHEELSKRRAEREQKRLGRYQAADKANQEEPSGDAEK